MELPFFRQNPEEQPPGPVMMPRGGGGGGRHLDMSFWLWPLPKEDPFAARRGVAGAERRAVALRRRRRAARRCGRAVRGAVAGRRRERRRRRHLVDDLQSRMSDFFELRAPPPEPPVPPPMPEWVGPPENELGVAAPIRIEVVRLDVLAVGIIDVTAYTTGFSFRLAIRRRTPVKGTEQPFSFHGPGPPDPDSLLFGIQFADGGKATTLGRPRQDLGAGGSAAGPDPRSARRRGWTTEPRIVVVGVAASTRRAARVRVRVEGGGHPAHTPRRRRRADPRGGAPIGAAVAA